MASSIPGPYLRPGHAQGRTRPRARANRRRSARGRRAPRRAGARSGRAARAAGRGRARRRAARHRDRGNSTSAKTAVRIGEPSGARRGASGEAVPSPDAQREGEANMKFFIDTGDVGEVREAAAMGLVDGVTTNPSLIAKSGRKYRDVVVEICEIVNGPISAEVLGTGYDEMMAEAREWHKLHKNIVVKLPLTPEGLRGVRTCKQEGIRTNVTLCFSPNQALLAAKAGAGFISPFI